MKTRIDKAKRNVFFSVMLQILKIVLSFVGRMVFVHTLGAIYLGVSGLFSNILAILAVADLGMTTVMMFNLYKPLANGDTKKVAAYVNTFGRVYNKIALIVFILGVLLIPFLRYIINLPDGVDHIYVYYLLTLLDVSIGYLFINRITLLQADQNGYIVDAIDMVAQVMLFIAQMAVLVFTKSFTFYLIVKILSTVISNTIKACVVKNKYNDIITNTSLKLDYSERKRVAKNVKDVFFYRIGGVLQSNTDNILTSIFVGTIAVGYYSNYTMVTMAITSLITLTFNALKASIGNYNFEVSRKEQEKMFYIFEEYNYLLIAFCSICMYVLFPDFINMCFGKDYLLNNLTVIFIILNFYTSNIRQNIWVYRETTGLFARVKYVTLVTTTINVVLSIIGGVLFGITGIIAATVIARLAYAWWKEPKILFNEYFKSSSKKYLITYITRLIYAVLVALSINTISNMININNTMLIQSILRIVITTSTTIILLYLPFRKKQSIMILKNKVIKKHGKDKI